MNTARRAPVRLMTRLKNQREFTMTADVGGENLGGLDGAERVVSWELVLSARR